jgi:hypothetical protein
VRNRHASRPEPGSSAHARPSATNATVSLGRAAPAHPSGSGVPSASVAPLGVGDAGVDVTTPGDEVIVVVGVAVVHEARTTPLTRMSTTDRARMS